MPSNVTRRSFLKVAGWSAVSTLAGSLPGWMCRGAYAQAGGEVLVKSHCPLCPQGCGMDLIIRDGKLRDVKGMIEDPETRGCLCDRGKSLPEVLVSEQRIQTPGK